MRWFLNGKQTGLYVLLSLVTPDPASGRRARDTAPGAAVALTGWPHGFVTSTHVTTPATSPSFRAARVCETYTASRTGAS